eukprot:9110339-Alexandrium_andersonii.AAC.1
MQWARAFGRARARHLRAAMVPTCFQRAAEMRCGAARAYPSVWRRPRSPANGARPASPCPLLT